jgi:cell division protein FtsW (lipid II flippase)
MLKSQMICHLQNLVDWPARNKLRTKSVSQKKGHSYCVRRLPKTLFSQRERFAPAPLQKLIAATAAPTIVTRTDLKTIMSFVIFLVVVFILQLFYSYEFWTQGRVHIGAAQLFNAYVGSTSLTMFYLDPNNLCGTGLHCIESLLAVSTGGPWKWGRTSEGTVGRHVETYLLGPLAVNYKLVN